MDVLERGKQWAQDCGVEYHETGGENGARWKYLRESATCAVCSETIPAGRLVWTTIGATLATHIACQAPARSLLGCLDRGKLDRSLRGRVTEGTVTSAAKFLSKVDPVKCPRFKITAAPLVNSKYRDLAVEAIRFDLRRSVAEGQPQAAPAPRAKPAPRKPAAPKVEAVPASVAAEPVKPADVPGELPSCVAAWLERLVYGPKAEYARAWAEHMFCGADAPADPGAPWAEKARKRMEYVLAG